MIDAVNNAVTTAVSGPNIVMIACIAVLFVPVASFCNVVIDRLPLRLDEENEYGELWETRSWSEVVGGRSRCSHCDAPVRPIDNIPVLSYVVLKGRCRSCGERYGSFHLWVEVGLPLVIALVTWGSVRTYGWTWALVPVLFLVPVGAVVSVIDLRTLIVPTAVVWPAAAFTAFLCLVVVVAQGTPSWLLAALFGVLTLAGPLFVLWWIVPAGMGFGDVRLSVLLGMNVGFAAGAAGYSPGWGAMLAVLCLLLSSVVGIVMALPYLGVGRRKVPFGPALVIGALLCATLAGPILAPFAR